jgi:hypothetical protein
VWGISSVSGAALYEFYTNDIALPGEQVPDSMQEGSREPSRYLPYQKYFTGVAIERIRHSPTVFARELTIGAFRNLFVSDIAAIYYNGHTKLLPFSYNPESRVNIHELLSSGDISGAMQAATHMAPKILWVAILACLYGLAVVGWLLAFKHDRKTFLIFTMFLCFYGYFILASGLYVEAKYRLPALPLVIVVALYGLDVLLPKMRLLVGM